VSTKFAVDIHPAARIGRGIMLDHATGLVIGETARVGNNVSILQSVTLGGTGKEDGDRHPKICDGVLISAGAKILGNIRVGQGAKVGAGSVVLEDVPPHTTVAGVPAKVVGKPSSDSPALDMDHCWPCYDDPEPLCAVAATARRPVASGGPGPRSVPVGTELVASRSRQPR
jgi:serine O-acetyltransferase